MWHVCLFGWLLLSKSLERTSICNWSAQLQSLCTCLTQNTFIWAPEVSWLKVGWTLSSLMPGKHFFWEKGWWVGLVWASLTLSCLLLLYFFLKEKKKTTFQSFAEFTHEDSTNKFLTWKIKDIYVQCTKRKVFLTSESWCLYSLTKQRIMFERQGLTQTFLVF